MYIPLCMFFDGITSKGHMAETELKSDGIYISYTPSQGEKQELKFEYASIVSVIRRPGDKLLLTFRTSPQANGRSKSAPPGSIHPENEWSPT